MVWIPIKSNLFKECKRNVKIGCVYIPRLDSSYKGDKLDTFDILDYEVARYIRTHDVMMVGDFNARTGLNPDTTTCKNSIRCRHNKDTQINVYRKHLLQLRKNSGMIISNSRFFYDNCAGNFTYFSRRGKSTVDYLLLSKRSLNMLRDFKIRQLLADSDHCPLLFSLKHTKNIIIAENKGDVIDNHIFYKYIWQPEKKKLCQDFLKTQDCLYIYDQFISSVIDLSDNEHLCKSLYHLLIYLAENCLRKVIKNKSNAKSNRFPTNPWFDNECKNIKHLCNKISKTHDLSVSIYREECHDLRKKYKNIIQDKKRQYVKNQVDKFQNLVSQNPKFLSANRNPQL